MNIRVKKIVALIFLITFFLLYTFTVRQMMFPDVKGGSPASALMMVLQTRASVFLLLEIMALIFVYYSWVIKSLLDETVKNILLTVTVFLIMLVGAECFFLNYEETNAIGERWSYKLWDKKYMTHRTAFFYKDSKGEEQRADFRDSVRNTNDKEKKTVWFIGDSFTFGFGLEQTTQTFPALVEQLLNGKVTSINLGDGGADSYKEKETLFAFSRTSKTEPRAVVWQYFGNDIDRSDEGPDIHEKEIAKSSWVRFGRKYFQAKSFLLDYIYWEYFTRNESGNIHAYADFLNYLYKTDSLVVNGKTLKDSLGYITPYRKHLEPIKEASAYYKSKGVKFLVIIFPYLWEGGPENATQLYASRLENELKVENTDVINLAPLVKNIPVKNRIANSHDLHPSPMVSKVLADTIANYFTNKYNW